MELSLGISPCPNDTFIFDALIHQKIDTEGIQFNVVMEDVEALNLKAFQNKLDITKISFNAYTQLSFQYVLMNSGAALGFNCGPVLISHKRYNLNQINNLRIGIPGKNTTANLLLSLAFPEIEHKKEYLFSEIENGIINEEIDAGLIIHENRFTFEKRGFMKMIDLGEWWEKETHNAIPLGGIIGSRKLPKDLLLKIDHLIKKSVEFAFDNPASSLSFIKKHAQEMDEKIIQEHINLYVNEYSIDLGEIGRNAVLQLFNLAQKRQLIKTFSDRLFVTQ